MNLPRTPDRAHDPKSAWDENGVVKPPPDSRYVMAVCNPFDWSKSNQALVPAYYKDGHWHMETREVGYRPVEPKDFYIHWWSNLYHAGEKGGLKYA